MNRMGTVSESRSTVTFVMSSVTLALPHSYQIVMLYVHTSSFFLAQPLIWCAIYTPVMIKHKQKDGKTRLFYFTLFSILLYSND